MYITFSYLDKPTKAAAKSLSKKGMKFPLSFGKEKFSIIEANQRLQKLNNILYSQNTPSAKFLIVLTDSEGKVETAGTTYEFGPIDYVVESGIGASLVEVIQKDIYAGTDENMSVEESYRNDKLIEELDKALDGVEETSSEEASEEIQPWEVSSDHEVHEESLDQAIQDERQAEEEMEQLEESEELETEEKAPLVPKIQNSVLSETEKPRQYFDYEEYISPISDASELFIKQDEELDDLTSLQTLLSDYQEEEPWLNEKLKLYLQNEYTQSDISSLKQVFDRTRQEALAQTRSLLAEQYRNIQEDKVEERAYSQLAPTISELEEQFSDEIQKFVGSQEEKSQLREQELDDKESQEIERISKEIQGKYNRLKAKELEEKDNKIATYTTEEQEKFLKEKERLLEEEKIEILKEHDETLTQVRIEAKKETEDHIKKVFTNAIQVIQDKNKAILSTVNEQVILWKEERQKELLAKEKALEKERKEALKQQRIQLQKEKQALRRKELQLKEMELGKDKTLPSSNPTQPLVVAYPPSNDSGNVKTEQMIETLRNEIRDLKQMDQVNSQPKTETSLFRKKFSGLLLSGLILGSLAIGGVSVGMYNHFAGANVNADVQTETTTTSPLESNAKIVTPESNSKETLSPKVEEEKPSSDQESIREFLFNAGNKEQLESFNNAYPSTIGDLEIAILNNHAVNALKAYEKLSEEEKKDLGQAQKVAVKAYYTANNEIAKAEEVK